MCLLEKCVDRLVPISEPRLNHHLEKWFPPQKQAMSSITSNVPCTLLSAGRESVSVLLLLLLLLLCSWFVSLRPLFTALTCFMVLSLLHQSIVLCDALSSQLFQDVVQVSGVREAVARQVGAKLCLMVDLVPDDGVRLSGGA